MPRSGMPHPAGRLFELVAELVDALLEQQDARAAVRRSSRVCGSRPDALGIVPVGAQEGGADPARPERRPALEPGRVLAAQPCRALAGSRARRGPRSRRSAACRRRRAAASASAAARVSERAGSPSKSMMTKSLPVRRHLAEVEVAVAADAHPAEPAADDSTTCPRGHAASAAQELVDVAGDLRGQRALSLAQRAEHLPDEVPHRLVDASAGRAVRSGSGAKSGSRCARAEREVQLGRRASPSERATSR